LFDKDVESSLIARDSVEEGRHRRIVGMIAPNRDALPSSLTDLLDGCFE
jgi:hypothetical protein